MELLKLSMELLKLSGDYSLVVNNTEGCRNVLQAEWFG